MTPQEINLTIAKACGWVGIAPYHNNGPLWGKSPVGTLNALPNYHGDLNAMHEAEKVLGEKRIRSYVFTLAQILDTTPTVDLDDQFLNIHATAAQRAEAFLRTLNLWRQ